jgi:hypothetical protein
MTAYVYINEYTYLKTYSSKIIVLLIRVSAGFSDFKPIVLKIFPGNPDVLAYLKAGCWFR